MNTGEIRQSVESGLSQYFEDMNSGEFEGVGIYPENALELVTIFLAVSADCDTQDIISALNLSGKEELAEKFELATDIVGKDPKLTFEVIGLANHFQIAPEELHF